MQPGPVMNPCKLCGLDLNLVSIGMGGVGNKLFNDRAWSLQVRNGYATS
jgi:hypothetical protein